MADEDRLTMVSLGEHDTGWQQGCEGNPVDAAIDALENGEGCGTLEMMLPLVLASRAGITIHEATLLIAEAKTEAGERWIDRLRSIWEPGGAGD